MRTLSKTEIQVFRRCQREHLYAYVLRRRPVEKSEALRIGTIFDAAQGWWWKTASLTTALGSILASARDPFEAGKLAAMMTAYHYRWVDEPYDVLAVQKRLDIPLRDGVRFVVKIDAVVRDQRDGKIHLIESKSSSEDIEPGSWFWKRVALDIQISHYLAAAKREGIDAADVIYDVSKKPGLKPHKKVAIVKMTKTTAKEPGRPYANQQLKDETPEEYGERCLAAIRENPDDYFQRASIVRIGDEARAAEWDLLLTADQIVRAPGDRARNPDACFRYGSACPYFGVCTGASSICDSNLFTTESQS